MHATTPPNARVLSLPAPFEAAISASLSELGFSTAKPQALAQAVLRLSDYYLANPQGRTPWRETWAQAASLAYYFPLNLARNLAVAREASRLGFLEGLEHLVDFGSGTGSGLFAFTLEGRNFATRDALDISVESMSIAQRLGESAAHTSFETHVSSTDKPRGLRTDPAKTLLVASYALTELETIPDWWLDNEALAILEPSTRDDGRRLQRRRQDLIDAGYTIWAPCTHQKPCPLLTHSERDWCHDRIHWAAPEWMQAMERTLPMKNRTLTYSYLLARKTKKPAIRVSELARLVGDTLIEKGKTRQAVCRNEEREFLAWFPQRMKADIELQRGNLVELRAGLEKKSAEVRLPEPSAIREIAPEEHF